MYYALIWLKSWIALLPFENSIYIIFLYTSFDVNLIWKLKSTKLHNVYS